MKILFLANRVPYPPYRGDKLKIYNLAKRLCITHELHLLTFAQNKEDLEYIPELKKIFKEVHIVELPKLKSMIHCLSAVLDHRPFQVHYFRSAEMQLKVNELVNKEQYDVVHVQHLRMAQYLSDRSDIPRILDLPDAFSLYWKRKESMAKNIFLRWFIRNERKRVLQYERILKQYNLTLVCSHEDKQYLQEQHHINTIKLLPNGVDTITFAPRAHDYSHNHTLLFTGNMDYLPNVDGVLYFIKDILPIVREQYPNIQFIIAGQRPVKKILEQVCDYIKITGFVKDLAAVYNEASIVVAPLRFGAGTQNKVLEAMSMGIPVVCSNIGFQGLEIISGEGAIMEITPESFAESIIKLLDSEELRRRVGLAGMGVIQSRFSWDIVAQKLANYFNEVQ